MVLPENNSLQISINVTYLDIGLPGSEIGYGSLNFYQIALTDTGLSVPSQLLWDLDR